MTSILLAATAATLAACPTLEGDYLCLTSFSTTPEPWSLRQTTDAQKHDVYSFEKKDYVVDGKDHDDPSVSYKLTYRATCAPAATATSSAQLIIDETGDLDDQGKHYHFTNQNVLEMNAKDQLVSRYSHDGRLIDTMTCTRR